MKIKSLLIIAALLICLSPVSSFACACCADAGDYTDGKNKISSYEMEEIKKLNFVAPKLYATPAFPDDIKGITPLGEDFFLNVLLQNKIWKFSFKDEKGKTGTLNLLMPATVEDFKVDIHDTPENSEIQLYKELRFESRVQSGSGIFQKGIAPATSYFLVLQGRGNHCMNASDFTHWRLQITGRKADYVFFGDIKTD